MKTLLALGFLGVVAVGVTVTNQHTREAASHHDPARVERAIETRQEIRAEQKAEARKFDLDIQTIRPGGEAIASACYYDISPAVTTSPEKLPTTKSAWTQAGTIYVTGLPAGLIDGQHHLAWLTPAGTKTYRDPKGGFHTIPAYMVMPAPATVEYKPAPGAWMHDGRSVLDNQTR